MSDEPKVYEIGRLRKPAGRIKLEDGTEHDVLQIKSRVYHSLKAAKGSAYLDSLEASARELVPTMTDEQAGELTDEDRNDIVAIAGLGVEAVQRLRVPNVAGPAASPSTSPG